MILPPKDDRAPFYRNLIRETERASRSDRRQRFRRNRLWYLYGTDTNTPARYNRLLEYGKASASYLYSPSFARFDVVLPPEFGDHFLEEEDAARDAIHRLWQDSEAARTAALVVEAAHWQDTAIAKVFTDRNEPTIELISDFSDVCVMRESLNSWERQEMIVHFFVTDVATFRRMVWNRPDRDRLTDMAQQYAVPGQDTYGGAPAAIANILLIAASPSMQGNVSDMGETSLAIPKESEPLVKLAEAWVWDDHAHVACDKCGRSVGAFVHEHERLSGLPMIHEFKPGDGYEGDYRVVLYFEPTEEILQEPRNPLEPGKHPFHALCLNETPGYLWGIAPIEPLIPLQRWREERLSDIRLGLDKQFDPPLVATGIQGLTDEALDRLRTRGSNVQSAMPGGKVEPVNIPMPPDAFAEIQEIDRMIDELGGLPARVRGSSDTAVRSGDQLMAGATLGAGPTLARAMIVENFINSVVTDLLHLYRRVSKKPLRKANGEEFLPSQLPAELVALVSAHSASPIYQQQLLPKVDFAAKHKWIDAEDGVDLLQLPGSEKKRAKARKLQAAQAEKAEKVTQAQIHKLEADAAKKTADAKKL